MLNIKYIVTYAITALTIGMPEMSSAQNVAPPAADNAGAPQGHLEDIIVTAQRRAERLQDVPVSVTAFGANSIATRQIVDSRALQAVVPNLTITGSFAGPNDILIGLRGLGVATVNNNVDTTVGVYVDGVYYARSQGANVAMTDMERVEVLRGPQGTLFGRNTIGGALNITTHQPVDRFQASMTAGYGNYNEFAANAMLNIPIINDKLAARFVYDHQQHDGYGYTINPAAQNRQNSNQNQDYFRASLKANPTENLDVTLYGDHFNSRTDSELWVVSYFDPTIAKTGNAAIIGSTYLCPTCRSNDADFNPINTTRTWDATGTVNWALGAVALKSITAYRKVDFVGGADIDASPIRQAELIYASHTHQFSEELQASGKAFDNRFDWIAGAYYFREYIDNPSTNITPTGGLINALFDGKNSSKSVFAQATYAITPKLRLTAGARYVEDKRAISYRQPTFNLANQIIACRLPAGLSPAANLTACTYSPNDIGFHYLPWTVSVDYKPDAQSLYYAKYAKGYRSGGFQIPGSNRVQGFAPFSTENVDSYEVGTHQMLAKGRLQLNAAGFYANYNDIQQNVPQTIPGSTTAFLLLINAGKARIWGGEFEATALVGKLKLSGSLGYVHPEFTSGPYKGTNFVGVSKTNWSVSADYPIILNIGELNLHTDYAWQSREYFYAPINTTTTPFSALTPGQINSLSQSSYGLLNALVSFKLNGSGLTLSAWGRNLAGIFYTPRALSFYTQGYNTRIAGAPRTFGGSATYRF